MEAPEAGASCRDGVEGYLEEQGEAAWVGDPAEAGPGAALGAGPGAGQGAGLVVGLEVRVEAEALGVLAFQVASGMEGPLEGGQEEGP